jgi:sugar lactone lactonase YvrE
MKSILASAFLALMAFTMEAQSFVSDKLSRKWETPALLGVPESVCFDTDRNVIYVSCIVGAPADKDGNGYISKVSADGHIIAAEWVKGLNAPKGMGIAGNYLYVSDITRVVWIDIARSEIAGSLEIPGSQFLNDITSDGKGNVYVSDMNGNAIYVIADGKYKLLAKSEELNGPNGLFFEGNRLLAGLKDRVVSIDPAGGSMKDYILHTGGIDGLVPDGKGNYLISDWSGRIHLIHPSKEKEKLLDTTPDEINAADIDFVISKKLLLVPTFFDNRVIAYELK